MIYSVAGKLFVLAASFRPRLAIPNVVIINPDGGIKRHTECFLLASRRKNVLDRSIMSRRCSRSGERRFHALSRIVKIVLQRNLPANERSPVPRYCCVYFVLSTTRICLALIDQVKKEEEEEGGWGRAQWTICDEVHNIASGRCSFVILRC